MQYLMDIFIQITSLWMPLRNVNAEVCSVKTKAQQPSAGKHGPRLPHGL